jgi:hypothetical protein
MGLTPQRRDADDDSCTQERAQLDEAVYAAARDGDRAALESLLGRGATSVLRAD